MRSDIPEGGDARDCDDLGEAWSTVDVRGREGREDVCEAGEENEELSSTHRKCSFPRPLSQRHISARGRASAWRAAHGGETRRTAVLSKLKDETATLSKAEGCRRQRREVEVGEDAAGSGCAA